jgi:hypothetical protein
MNEDKKIWFKGVSRTLWIPISLEGWSVSLVFALGIFLLSKVNKVSDEVAFRFSEHWSMLLEMAILIFAMYWVSRGHVDKNY